MNRLQPYFDLNDDLLELQETITYDPFGNVVSRGVEQGMTNDLDADDPLVFGTDNIEVFDDVAGTYRFDGLAIDEADDALQYHAARCYDPSQGRWLNQEPLGFEAGQDNMFRYPSAAQQ